MANIFKNAVSKAVKSVSEAVSDAVGSALGGAGSSKNSYGINARIELKVDDCELKTKEFTVTDMMIETVTSNKAGVCEVRMQAIIPSNKNDLKLSDTVIPKIKAGHSFEVLISNSSGKEFGKPTTVFKGFIENRELVWDKRILTCIIHGMDAKMWMMANRFTGERGENAQYSAIVQKVFGNYAKHAKIGKVDPASDTKVTGKCYQVDESDYEFICKIAEMTGSLFFIDNLGQLYFCSSKSLISNSEKIEAEDEHVCRMSSKTGVWGTVKKVKVVATDSSNAHKIIKATSNSAEAIGRGKDSSGMVSRNYSSENTGVRHINIYDDSIKSQQEAQALAKAIYTKREANLVETEVMLVGNPKLSVGTGAELKGFGKPFDNKYLISAVRHVYGIYSEDGQYHTSLILHANRSEF